MIQTLRKPKLRTPPRHVGHVHSVETSTRTIRCDASPMPDRDPSALASSLRDVSVSAHRALAMGVDDATRSHLAARIEGIEHGFRELGLHDLARFAGNLKQRLESRD